MKKNPVSKKFLFGRKNYKVLFIALVVISLGFILMSGGGSQDPYVFNKEIYNFRRIRLAPALVIIGFGIAVYSIFTNPLSRK